MTLVVARVTPIGVRVAGDMRITDPNAAGPRGFLGAALKVILLRPTLCIGYAGNVGLALAAIRRVASEDLSAEDVESQLLDVHRRSDGNTDFLIASLRPSRLVVVKNGRAKASSAAWIGDQRAFAEYQLHYYDELRRLLPLESYDSPERAEDIAIATRMGNGMEAVVHGASFVIEGETRILTRPQGGSHQAVGEAIVYVVLRAEDDLFGYSVLMRATASVSEESGVGSLETSAARGVFSYKVLVPTQPGVGIVGLYFDQGQLGVIYAPLLLDDPERYPGVSRDAFIELVRLRHGISLHGIG
jgi:hypothetical protein